MTVLTFLVLDCFNIGAILVRGAGPMRAMLSLSLREALVSCLLLLPVYPPLRAIRRIFSE